MEHVEDGPAGIEVVGMGANMMNLDELFGGKTAAFCLTYLASHESATALEISLRAKIAKAQVFIQLRRLEEAGVLCSIAEKNKKIYSLNKTAKNYEAFKRFLLESSTITPSKSFKLTS